MQAGVVWSSQGPCQGILDVDGDGDVDVEVAVNSALFYRSTGSSINLFLMN